MDDWEYEELFESVKENYYNYLKKKLSEKHALARTSYDFETVRNEGIIENLIVATALGEIISSHKQVFIGNLNSINETINKTNLNELHGKLLEKEINDLAKKMKIVLNSLNNMPIDYNSSIDIE